MHSIWLTINQPANNAKRNAIWLLLFWLSKLAICQGTALSAFINLKWAVLIDNLIKRITIDANSVIRSATPQTPATAQHI